MILLPETEDRLVFAPSYHIAAVVEANGERFTDSYLEQAKEEDLLFMGILRQISEGKSLGTAKERNVVFQTKDPTIRSFLDPKKYAEERKIGADVGRRQLKEVQKRTEVAVLRTIETYLNRRMKRAEFAEELERTMKTAWRDVFLAGARASGLSANARWETTDEVWLKSAMSHEMRFLNGLIEDVQRRSWTMPLPRRVRMYVDSLTSFYENARVIGVPATSLIYWVGAGNKGLPDDRTCPGCVYLMEHSPYLKLTLPCVPRSGYTPCLTHCRDRLLVRRGDPIMAETLKITAAHTRGMHIRNLRKIRAAA